MYRKIAENKVAELEAQEKELSTETAKLKTESGIEENIREKYPAMTSIAPENLLLDLYALDANNRIYSGVDTYSQVLRKMRYLYPLGLFLSLPGIHFLAVKKYREIADSRDRVTCSTDCLVSHELQDNTWYHRIFECFAFKKPKAFSRKLSRILIAIIVLQLNSTIHYGLFYRLDLGLKPNAYIASISEASNALIMMSLTFLGITPHALYLHDHFAGYNRILAITFIFKKLFNHKFKLINWT